MHRNPAQEDDRYAGKAGKFERLDDDDDETGAARSIEGWVVIVPWRILQIPVGRACFRLMRRPLERIAAHLGHCCHPIGLHRGVWRPRGGTGRRHLRGLFGIRRHQEAWRGKSKSFSEGAVLCKMSGASWSRAMTVYLSSSYRHEHTKSYIYIYICMYVCMYVCMYMYIYIYIYISIYIYMYIYIYNFLQHP